MGISSFILGQAASQIKGMGSTISSAINQAAQGDINGALASLGGAFDQSLETLGSTGAASPGDAARAIAARGDAIQNWCWYALMPTVNPGETPRALGSTASVALPWYYVQKANTPFRVLETEAIKRNGHQVHLPTSYSVPNLTLEFFMDSHNVAQKYLKAWGSLVLGTAPVANIVNRGVWGLPSRYKKNIYLYVLSVSRKQLLVFKYVNCWPADPQALELMSSDPALLVQTVNFMVEDMEVTVLNDKGVIDNLIDAGKGYGITALQGLF